MKGKKQTKSSDISQDQALMISFLSFTPEDFTLDDAGKISGTEELLTHVCSQYKVLLEQQTQGFWSTIRFNPFINRSLDSFLSFAKKPYYTKPIPVPGHTQESKYSKKPTQKYLFLLRELYRLVFQIYLRLCEDPRANGLQIEREEIIYDNWLFDLPKFFDICSIYGQSNRIAVSRMIKEVFDFQPNYIDDFKEFLKLLREKLIPENLKLLSRHRKREDLDTQIVKSDTEEKEKLIASLFDLLSNIEYIIDFFPKSLVNMLFYDDGFFIAMEQIYLTLNSGAKLWKLSNESKAYMNSLVRITTGKILSSCSTLLKRGAEEATDKNKNFWTQFGRVLNNVGKSLKKKDGEPNYKFLRKLMKYFDFGEMLHKAPTAFIKSDDNERFQVILLTQLEKIPDGQQPKSSPEKNKAAEQEQKMVEEKPKEEEAVKKEAEQKIDDGKEDAIKIIEMTFGKRDKKRNIWDDDDVEQIKTHTKTTLMLAEKAYDDEYDDTLEMYEEERFKVEGNNDEDEPDDLDSYKIEGTVSKDEKDQGKHKKYDDKKYDDRRYDDRKYEEKRYDDKRYVDKKYDDKKGDDRKYDDKKYDDRRYEDKKYDKKGQDDRRSDNKGYDDKRYDDRRQDDNRYEDRRNDYKQSSYKDRPKDNYDDRDEEEEREKARYNKANYNKTGEGYMTNKDASRNSYNKGKQYNKSKGSGQRDSEVLYVAKKKDN